MARKIDIDDDVYEFLRQAGDFGESVSDVLRRLLGGVGRPANIDYVVATQTVNEAVEHELADVLASAQMRHARGVVGKFLEVLRAVHARAPHEFEIVLAIQGRERVYFAKSKEEIEASGNSTQPRQIPGTDYWVMTNSPTDQKQWMLKEVLRAMGYSKHAIDAAAEAISSAVSYLMVPNRGIN